MKLPLLRALLPRPATVEGLKRRWRRGIVIIAAFGLAGSGVALLTPATPALAAAGCTATYSVPTDWGAGFTAQFTVTNTGTTAITGWTITYSYTQGQTLQNGWNGTWTEGSGGAVTVVNAPYNGSLAPGASATGVGANFNETSQGNNHTLTATCTPQGGTTTPTINASPTSLSVQQGHTGTFTLALSAAPTSNETVSIAASGNSGLTASPTTLTFTPSNFSTAQTVTVTANASGTGQTTFTASGTGYTSATVTANETQGTTPSITATPTSLNVTQSKTGTFTLALSAAPTSNETVNVTASGNAGLTASPTTLTFTPSNFSTAQTVTITANATGTGVTTFTAAGTGYTSATISATEVPGGTNPTVMVSPASQNITQGLTGTVGVSLSSAPSANVTVTVARTSGNTGLSVTAGSSLTFTPSNFSTAQSVTITADASSTGAATFTVSGTGVTSATFTATEAAACTTNCTHVADPFTGSTPYLNPDYVAEVNAQVSADGGNAAEAKVATFQTAIWLDTMASINGGTTATGTRTGLQQQLTNAAAIGTASKPALVEIVIYDLPGRDCAALASNGEIPGTTAGLTTYEQNYINPIATILQGFQSSNIRVVAIIEPDSLPNAVTNTNMQSCSTAAPLYEQGITYALNKLHAISNVYNYLDIAHSAWLGWPTNQSKTPAVYNAVVTATTAGYASIDGFISDTANYTPVQEPFLPNPNLNVGGMPIMNVTFYSSNPTFDELTYDTQMYNTLMSAGFPASKKFLIDTSRDGWGGPLRPTALNSSPTDAVTYVNDNKIDQRPFRGDWCNQNNAGIGAPPTDQPFGSSSPVLAYVWIKPPGESDGDYPSGSHTHGDPHCDPTLNNQTDGSGHSFNTGSIPGFDVPAGNWFAAEFQMLVKNAFPAL
jgi:cellulose 1,4-beta-cellobiosidase